MSFQLLDLILIGIMLISGILALMRGFTREVLSLVAWGLAALAAYFAIRQEKLVDLAMTNVPYLEKDTFAKIAVGAAAFLVVLVVVSVISIKFADMVVDSSAGAFDRTLGFFFGLARGFVLVAIAYLFYGWLTPPNRQEAWVRDAASMPYILTTGGALCELVRSLGGGDVCDTLRSTALGTAAGEPPGDKADPQPGYPNNETQGLDNLIQGTGNTEQQPQFGQSKDQGTGQ